MPLYKCKVKLNSSVVYIGEHDLGKDVSLESLLRFITGTSTIPPMGLRIPIEIAYYPQSGVKCYLVQQFVRTRFFFPLVILVSLNSSLLFAKPLSLEVALDAHDSNFK